MGNSRIVDKMVRNAEQNKKMAEEELNKSMYANVAQQTTEQGGTPALSPLGFLDDIPRKLFRIQLEHKTLGCLTKDCYSQGELVNFIKDLSFVDIRYLQIEYR